MSQATAVGPAITITADDLMPLRPWSQAADDPDHPSFSRVVQEQWQPITAGQHLSDLVATARGLIASGVEAGDRVALMSETRYEWLLLDEAIWNAGGVTVPVYPSSSPSQVEWIVEDSGARLLVVETREHADAILAAHRDGEAAGLDIEVLVIDGESGALADLASRGESVPESEVTQRRGALTAESLASLVYTSGTTGRPKGVEVTHGHFAAEVKGLLEHPIGSMAAVDKRLLMFLPLAHVLARAVTYTAARAGATVGFWADFSTIIDRLGEFKPAIMLGVPRVFEKVHDGIRAQAQRSGRVPGLVFARGEQVALQWSEAIGEDIPGRRGTPSLPLRLQHALFDRLLYRKIRDAVGGECQYAISGGGALGDRLGHFFRGVGLPIYEGYGLTETCAAITVNGPGCQVIGTVGAPIAGNEVRIAESGEILLRGAVVMQRYWRNDEATAESVDKDGWFATGDLGSLDERGYLRITGRAKEIIVTAGGKNVIPGVAEDVIRGHRLVANAMVVGEGRPFVAALITIDTEALAHWASEKGLSGSTAELLESDALREEIQSVVDQANASVSRAESVRTFVLLEDDFTEDRDELTATLKLRRHVIESTREAEIERLYQR